MLEITKMKISFLFLCTLYVLCNDCLCVKTDKSNEIMLRLIEPLQGRNLLYHFMMPMEKKISTIIPRKKRRHIENKIKIHPTANHNQTLFILMKLLQNHANELEKCRRNAEVSLSLINHLINKISDHKEYTRKESGLIEYSDLKNFSNKAHVVKSNKTPQKIEINLKNDTVKYNKNSHKNVSQKDMDEKSIKIDLLGFEKQATSIEKRFKRNGASDIREFFLDVDKRLYHGKQNNERSPRILNRQERVVDNIVSSITNANSTTILNDSVTSNDSITFNTIATSTKSQEQPQNNLDITNKIETLFNDIENINNIHDKTNNSLLDNKLKPTNSILHQTEKLNIPEVIVQRTKIPSDHTFLRDFDTERILNVGGKQIKVNVTMHATGDSKNPYYIVDPREIKIYADKMRADIGKPSNETVKESPNKSKFTNDASDVKSEKDGMILSDAQEVFFGTKEEDIKTRRNTTLNNITNEYRMRKGQIDEHNIKSEYFLRKKIPNEKSKKPNFDIINGNEAPDVKKEEEEMKTIGNSTLNNIANAYMRKGLVDEHMKSEDFLETADIVNALAVPVLLVILVGAIMYAVHNMSRLFNRATRDPSRRNGDQNNNSTTQPAPEQLANTTAEVQPLEDVPLDPVLSPSAPAQTNAVTEETNNETKV